MRGISINEKRWRSASANSGSGQLVCVAVCVMLLGAPGWAAAADSSDVLNVITGGSITHDSNLFRLPNSVSPQVGLGSSTKSDTVTTGYVGLRINKPYAQQRFQLDLTETLHRYDNFSRLNFNAFDYRAAWLWHLSPKVSGTLSAERTQTLVPFEDYRLLSQQRNVRDNENRTFNLDWWAFGGWHLLLGVSNIEQKSDAPFLAEADFNLIDYQIGTRYESAAGNSIAFIQHVRRGDYANRVADPVNLLDSSFREYESEFRLKWKISGHSSIDGRLGWLDRHHDLFPQRDYSGVVGELGYGWTPTAKLKVYVVAKRSIDAVVDAFSSYRVNNSFSVTPAWRATEKVTLSLRLDRVESDFRGAVAAPPGALRSDTLHSLKFMADWVPTRNVSLSAGLQKAERSSNTPTGDFDTSIFYIRGGFKF
jgi:exopolysaccharide biosynthesis operon protein EpsL